MHDSVTDHERQMLHRAHVDLSAAIARFDEVAWALPGPVPAHLADDYADAIGLALASVRFSAAQADPSGWFRRYVEGLEELARDSLDALPTDVGADEAAGTADWATVAGWLNGGRA